MSIFTKAMAGLAGVIHVLFFAMESVLWLNPSVHSIFLVKSVADAELLEAYVKNQGFYNLFLAIGMFAGLWIVTRNQEAGRILILYISLFMIGAAIVLRLTIPDMTMGPYIQGVAPLLAIVALIVERRAAANAQ